MNGPRLDSEGVRLIDLKRSLPHGFMGSSARYMATLMEPLIRFERLNAIYEDVRVFSQQGSGNFFDWALSSLGVRFEVSDEDRERIPLAGPLVSVSNHPYGGLDGVILGALLSSRRPDVKLLVNYLLWAIEEMRPYLINVDPFGGKDSQRSNLAGMRSSIRWLREGGALGLFPSGTVSHLNFRKRQVTDPKWIPNLGGLIRRSGADVIPIYFEGRNSNFFQAAGVIHPLLRTLMLPREMIGMRSQCIQVKVGNPIPAKRLLRFEDDEGMMNFLRLKTYILQNRTVADKTSFRIDLRRQKKSKLELIPEAEDAAVLATEIDKLTQDQCLVEQGDYRVYYARAQQIPNVLDEIGRLREITFREVGEGTGMARDLDKFDSYYIHLFMWNRVKREIVGAYRIGATDEILPRYGKYGLYTTTLFRYRSSVLEKLNPALELGRSFIVAAYQRKHISLGLIWRGIGCFVVKYPRYKTLFGPVSISQEYKSLSKNMMVMYLKEHTLDPELSEKVKGKKPPRSRYFGRLDRSSFSASVKDIEDVSALISEIEREERGVPVLLKQYLKLNATMLSFNVDPEFNDCIDGLVLVDLLKTNGKTLARYMGEDGLKSFYSYHEIREPVMP